MNIIGHGAFGSGVSGDDLNDMAPFVVFINYQIF